jgi:hypothetical protein
MAFQAASFGRRSLKLVLDRSPLLDERPDARSLAIGPHAMA